ncbi:hypothetical protein HEK616_40470 [Streptomyces nigrescens]|uniref:RNA polymerase sigma-70 region 2 domain-containing protein n=1 Tax=Streptomyces nigrescens TaxID=1920 RepID=A0ABM7ZW17_STRNI|nr:hypothetical protein [Streptomyces nigrescens]BDM70560.1 hypothetical protein HEK616_40470 [Streptomyces nigrescens]
MSHSTVTPELIREAQAGNESALWEVVSAHDYLIRSIVSSVAPGASREAAEDLLQEGRAVILERLRSYDAEVGGGSLTTAAYVYLRRAITEEWLRMSTGLTISAGTVIRVRAELARQDGDVEAASRALAAEVDKGSVLAVVEALAGMESLEAPMSADDERGATLADTIADPTSEVTDPAERRALARWLMEQIPARQAYALRAFHGVGMSPVPDVDAANQLQVKPGVLRNLRSRGLISARSVAANNNLAA